MLDLYLSCEGLIGELEIGIDVDYRLLPLQLFPVVSTKLRNSSIRSPVRGRGLRPANDSRW
jgi:hypothetical protein